MNKSGEILRSALADPRARLAMAGAVVLAVGLGIAVWQFGITPAHLGKYWSDCQEYLRVHPFTLFAAMVFLPGLPIPMTALLLLAGAVWGPTPAACGLTLLALALNMTWTYWIAAYPARGVIEKALAQTGLKIPDLPRNDQLRLILILRLTPGIPLFIHNYLLGFLRVPFFLYLGLSIALSGAIAIGILLTGGAILEGKAGAAITGVSLLVVGIVVTRYLRSRFAPKGNKGEGVHPMEESSAPSEPAGARGPATPGEPADPPPPDPASDI